jgi:hypothetical protein
MGVKVAFNYLYRADADLIESRLQAMSDYIRALEYRVIKLEGEVKSDIHEHVRALVRQNKELEEEIKDLKSRIRFPVD